MNIKTTPEELARKCALKIHELIRFNVAQGTIKMLFTAEILDVLDDSIPLRELLELASKVSALPSQTQINLGLYPIITQLQQKDIEL